MYIYSLYCLEDYTYTASTTDVEEAYAEADILCNVVDKVEQGAWDHVKLCTLVCNSTTMYM